jgi:hypothetical protein
MNNKKYYLYGLYCPYNNKLNYIGITTGLLSTRLSSHLRNPTNGKIALWFKQLINNNKKPIIKLIKEYLSYDDLLNGEIEAIKNERISNEKLLNIADGGNINPMFNKTHSQEAKDKISKNNKGLKRSEEQKNEKKRLLSYLWSCENWSNKLKEKMRNNMIGNKRALNLIHTKKTKEFLSNLHKGNKYCLGFKHSEETKKFMSINNSKENNPMFGKRLSKETLTKRSNKVKLEGTYKGKNNGNFKYKIEKNELYNLFIINNLKIEEIAKYYGCHRGVISNNLKKYNIKKENSNKYNINLEDIKKHLNNGLTQVELGNIYGCGNIYINKLI